MSRVVNPGIGTDTLYWYECMGKYHLTFCDVSHWDEQNPWRTARRYSQGFCVRLFWVLGTAPDWTTCEKVQLFTRKTFQVNIRQVFSQPDVRNMSAHLCRGLLAAQWASPRPQDGFGTHVKGGKKKVLSKWLPAHVFQRAWERLNQGCVTGGALSSGDTSALQVLSGMFSQSRCLCVRNVLYAERTPPALWGISGSWSLVPTCKRRERVVWGVEGFPPTACRLMMWMMNVLG